MRIIIALLALVLSSSAYAVEKKKVTLVEKKKVALIKKAQAQVLPSGLPSDLPSDRPSERPSDLPVIGSQPTESPENKEDGNKEDKKEKAPPVCTVEYANGYLGLYKCEVDGTTCIVANGGSTDMHCK